MIDSEMVSTPGGTLHVRVIGSGPPVLLLHGFPDSSLGFRELCESLAARGFRAIAPDLLGYGLSDKPPGIAPYRATAVVEDLAALVRWAGGRVALLGHDWGGFLAFCLAAEHPELVSRLVILNAPHPESYARALRRSFQLFRAWYILFFQLRRVAEWVVSSRLFFRWMMRQLVARRELMTESRVEAGRRELLRPGAMTGALGYYRAMFRWGVRCPRRIQAPTLILWGDADPSLGVGLLDDIDQHVAEVRVERVPGAGHFVHWDEPELVVREVTGFLGG